MKLVDMAILWIIAIWGDVPMTQSYNRKLGRLRTCTSQPSRTKRAKTIIKHDPNKSKESKSKKKKKKKKNNNNNDNNNNNTPRTTRTDDRYLMRLTGSSIQAQEIQRSYRLRQIGSVVQVGLRLFWGARWYAVCL